MRSSPEATGQKAVNYGIRQSTSIHAIPGFDVETCSNAPLPQRIRYLFEFLSTTRGQLAFQTSVDNNIENLLDEQANQIDRLSTAHEKHQSLLFQHLDLKSDQVWAPRLLELTATLTNASSRLHALGVEVEMSRAARARIDVAAQARRFLSDVEGLTQLEEIEHGQLEELFVKFQDGRDRVVNLMIQAERWTDDYGVFIGRHRNELWDIWG